MYVRHTFINNREIRKNILLVALLDGLRISRNAKINPRAHEIMIFVHEFRFSVQKRTEQTLRCCALAFANGASRVTQLPATNGY